MHGIDEPKKGRENNGLYQRLIAPNNPTSPHGWAVDRWYRCRMGEHQTTVVGSRRITFVEALGKGGFGAVYLADIQGRGNFAQRLAVKVLNEELSHDADVVGRQRDEARLLAQL